MTTTAKDLETRRDELEASLAIETSTPEAVAKLRDEAVEVRRRIMRSRDKADRKSLEDALATIKAKSAVLTKDRDEKRSVAKAELRAVRAKLVELARETVRSEFEKLSEDEIAAKIVELRNEAAELTERAQAAQLELDLRAARAKVSRMAPAERRVLLELANQATKANAEED